MSRRDAKIIMRGKAKIILVGLVLIAAALSAGAAGPMDAPSSVQAATPSLGRGAVFVMTNQLAGNAILVFRRTINGQLTSLTSSGSATTA
jgi:hypothetical protein